MSMLLVPLHPPSKTLDLFYRLTWSLNFCIILVHRSEKFKKLMEDKLRDPAPLLKDPHSTSGEPRSFREILDSIVADNDISKTSVLIHGGAVRDFISGHKINDLDVLVFHDGGADGTKHIKEKLKEQFGPENIKTIKYRLGPNQSWTWGRTRFMRSK